MPKLRNGHAPGHVRETFLSAVDAFLNWRPGEAEPTVEYEIHYVPHQILISRACGLVWNCTDIIPGTEFGLLQDALTESGEPVIGRQTYAAGARAMLDAIRSQQRT
jgi:hypothetical protein